MKKLVVILLALAIGCNMGETGGTRPDASKAVWCDGSGFPRTEPAGSKKLAGYNPGSAPSTPGEVPSATDHNWLFGFWADILRYLDASHIREFEDVGEAITDTTAPELFRVKYQGSDIRVDGLQVYSAVPAGFTQLDDAATDGEYAFYLDNSGLVQAVNPDDGTQQWLLTPTNAAPGAIATDGEYFYLASTAGGIIVGDRSDGSVVVTGTGTPTFSDAMACNGDWCCIASLNNIYYYNTAIFPPNETASTSHGNPIAACALDDEKVYFGGFQGTSSIDVRAHVLSTRAQAWAITLPTSSAALVRAIETDGDLVYVGTTRVGLTAGGNANLFVLSAYDGSVVHTMDVQTSGTTDNITHIALDGDKLYLTLDGTAASVCAVRLSPYSAIVNDYSSVVIGYDADGIGLIASDGPIGAAAQRYYTQSLPRDFARVNGTDGRRSPFHKLAIPLR